MFLAFPTAIGSTIPNAREATMKLFKFLLLLLAPKSLEARKAQEQETIIIICSETGLMVMVDSNTEVEIDCSL